MEIDTDENTDENIDFLSDFPEDSNVSLYLKYMLSILYQSIKLIL